MVKNILISFLLFIYLLSIPFLLVFKGCAGCGVYAAVFFPLPLNFMVSFTMNFQKFL